MPSQIGLYHLCYAGSLADELKPYTVDATVGLCRTWATACKAIGAELAVVKYPQGCAPLIGGGYPKFIPERVMPGWPEAMEEWRAICGWAPWWYLPPPDSVGNYQEFMARALPIDIAGPRTATSAEAMEVMDIFYPGWRISGGVFFDGSGLDDRWVSTAMIATMIEDGYRAGVEAWNSKKSPLARRPSRYEPWTFVEEQAKAGGGWTGYDTRNPLWADTHSPSKVIIAMGWPFDLDRAIGAINKGYSIVGDLPMTPDQLRAKAAGPAIT